MKWPQEEQTWGQPDLAVQPQPKSCVSMIHETRNSSIFSLRRKKMKNENVSVLDVKMQRPKKKRRKRPGWGSALSTWLVHVRTHSCRLEMFINCWYESIWPTKLFLTGGTERLNPETLLWTHPVWFSSLMLLFFCLVFFFSGGFKL